MSKKYLFIALAVSIISAAFFTAAKPKTLENTAVVVEAENYVKESGGQLQKMEGRTASSKNLCIAYWNDKDHWVEWVVNIPKTGEYKVVIRYCHNKNYLGLRDFMIDGKYSNKDLKSIGFESTGGLSRGQDDWKNLILKDKKGNDIIFKMRKGKHTIRMKNLGSTDAGKEADRSPINLDLIAFITPDVIPDKIFDFKTAGQGELLPAK